ncbi:DNA-directed RNA polymerase specialized sigma subunit, sigma24 family [Lentzea xinjiangensis]|uniref:DNA-directed RNA polymerase specialized sigma subunit, sigma24 family n=2 Tax=Lentzea xinjiangensis TaxID=402600 RepID=A0A1H9WMM8_9PSEU|nr:DNA-directed RNA polymerase specialized sigma subunit, sigma24 family [Lentzea xinjiangensis]
MAEDATHTVILRAMSNLPTTFDRSLKSWLCTVAVNVARDIRRSNRRNERIVEELQKQPEQPRGDRFRAVQIRLDTERLLTRLKGLIGESYAEHVDLSTVVLLTNITERDLAKRLGLSLDTVKNRRRTGRMKVQEAAAVLSLLTDDRHDSCALLLRIATNREDSPELLHELRVHINRCERCKDRAKGWKRLYWSILAIPGIALCGHLADRLAESGPRVRFAAVATAVAVAGILFLQGATSSETPSALEPGPTIELPIGRMNAVPAAPLPVSPPESTTRTPAQPERALVAVPPAPAATAPTKPTAEARAGRPKRTHRREHHRTAEPRKKCRKTYVHWNI